MLPPLPPTAVPMLLAWIQEASAPAATAAVDAGLTQLGATHGWAARKILEAERSHVEHMVPTMIRVAAEHVLRDLGVIL